MIHIIIFFSIVSNRRNMIEGCSFNSINKITMSISLIILPILLIILMIYFINLKHKNINEHFVVQNVETVINDYIVDDNNYCTFKENLMKPNVNFRDCEVYFTEDTEGCDGKKAEDPTNTCKYKLDGWSEFSYNIDNDGNKMIYDKKILTPTYSKDFINNNIISKCFKPLDKNEKSKFEYKFNDVMSIDCYGGKNSVNNYDNKNYTSIMFNNMDDKNDYNNVLNSICTKKFNIINSLKNKVFFKFELLPNGIINNFTKVKLNNEQTEFITDNTFDISTLLTFSSSIGIRYIGGTQFVLFKDNTIKPINVNIYNFKYNYLCSNSQIMSYDIYQEPIIIDRFITIPPVSTRTENIDNPLLKLGLLNSVINNQNKDNKDDIKNKIQSIFLNRYNEIINEYTGLNDSIIDALNPLTTRRQTTENTIKNLVLNFDEICKKLSILSGKYNTITSEPFNEDNIKNIINPQIITASNGQYVNGLIFKKYKGYHGDVVANFNNLPNEIHRIYKNERILNINTINDGTNLFQLENIEDYYTYIWEGFFKPQVSGNHLFLLASDDGSYLFINNILVVDNGKAHGRVVKENTVYLEAGVYYPIKIVFGEIGGGDNLTFYFKTAIDVPEYRTSCRTYYYWAGSRRSGYQRYSYQDCDYVKTGRYTKGLSNYIANGTGYFYSTPTQNSSELTKYPDNNNYTAIQSSYWNKLQAPATVFFDNNLNSTIGGHYDYSYINGNFIEAKDKSANTYKGEYLLIKLDKQIVLKEFKFFIRRNLSQRCPGVFRVYGTNNINEFNNYNNEKRIDFKEWNLIHDQKTIISYTNNPVVYKTSENNNDYLIYCLIVNKLNGSGVNSDYLNFTQWGLYGLQASIMSKSFVKESLFTNKYLNEPVNIYSASPMLSNLPNYNTDNIIINNNTKFNYNLCAFVFIKKGYSKIDAYLNLSSNIMYECELHIIINNNMYVLSKLKTTINAITKNGITESAYIYMTRKEYLYFPESGFYKIFFKSTGYNISTKNLTTIFAINCDYTKTATNTAIDISKIANNDILISENITILSEIRANRKSYNNMVFKNLMVDKTKLLFIFKNMYNLETDIVNYDNYINYMKDILLFPNQVEIENEKNQEKKDLAIHYSIILGLTKDIINNKYKNIISRYDTRLKDCDNLLLQIEGLSNVKFDKIPIELTKSQTINNIFSNTVSDTELSIYKTVERFDRSKLTTSGSIPLDTPRSIYIERFI